MERGTGRRGEGRFVIENITAVVLQGREESE